MNLEASDPSSLEVLDSSAMTILESMVPTEGHSAQQMVIYVQTNPQGGGQVLPIPEDIPLTSFTGVESLDPYGASGEPIVTLVDELGQALGEGQAVPVALSDVSKIDFVNRGGEMFQAEDGQVLYLTYTVENGAGETSIPGDIQSSGGVDMITGLNIPSSQIQRQIVLHMGGGEGSYMVASGETNELSLVAEPVNSVPVLGIPEFKKPTNSKSKKQNVVNQTSQRKTARVIGPEVFIEDKLQVLEAIVPRLERPKKKKSEMKSLKDDADGDFPKELCEKEDEEETLESKVEETDDKSKGGEREEDGLYMCDLCGAAYSRAAQYYGHLHSHSGERDWNCHLCGESFKSHSQLRRHEARSHLNMRPYPCSVCGSRFDRASQLRYHERRIHDGEKPHRCLICSKGFFKRSDLRTHVNIHLGINKSICETCGKQFNHVSNLIRHIRVHTGIKPYPCNICGRRFSQVNALQHHKDSHNTSRDFGCSLCRKQFKSNLLLKKHMRSMHASSSASNQEDDVKAVNQNRRYYCNVCGEDFPFSAMLKDHEVKHQKETNFHCNCCGNDYTSADEFKVHSCLEVEESKNNKKDDSKRDMMNSYNELMSRINEEAAEEVEEQEMEAIQGDKVAEQMHNLGKVTEIEPNLTKAQELILDMEKNQGVQSVDDEQNVVVSEPMKIESEVQDSKMCSTLNVLNSGGMETSWVVDTGCSGVAMNSEGKWLSSRPQDESEIVIYVTPDLRQKDRAKEDTHSNGAYFKKYEDFVNAAMDDNVGEFSMPSVDHLDQEHDDEINDQMNAIDPLLTSTSDASNVELTDPLDVGEKKGETEYEIVLEDNTSSTGAPKEKTKVPGKTFKCDECGKIFSKNSNYKQHLGIHFVDLQRYQCKICGHSFAWKSTLNKHMANSHQTGPTPKFTCGFCSKEYTTSSQVQEHIKRDHFKERPHTCTECNKTFYKKYDLKIHLRTHTKEKPYICGACGKAFYHLSHIIRHERIHTGERPYKCEDCGREFNQSSTLKTHKSRHSNCSALKKKSEASGKSLLGGDGGMNPLQEGTKRSRSQKRSAVRKAETNVDKVILLAKDPNLDFSNIPTTYEDI